MTVGETTQQQGSDDEMNLYMFLSIERLGRGARWEAYAHRTKPNYDWRGCEVDWSRVF